MRLHAVLIAAALLAPGMAQAADNGCDFNAPTPMLRARAYAGQSFTAKPENAALETAALGGGVMLTINHSQCVDIVEHDFVLTVPNDPKAKRAFGGWVNFALATLSGLKVRNAETMNELIGFLKKASTMKPKGDTVTMCRNGKVQDVCGWDEGGTLSVEVKPGAKSTTLTVVEGLAG